MRGVKEEVVGIFTQEIRVETPEPPEYFFRIQFILDLDRNLDLLHARADRVLLSTDGMACNGGALPVIRKVKAIAAAGDPMELG